MYDLNVKEHFIYYHIMCSIIMLKHIHQSSIWNQTGNQFKPLCHYHKVFLQQRTYVGNYQTIFSQDILLNWFFKTLLFILWQVQGPMGKYSLENYIMWNNNVIVILGKRGWKRNYFACFWLSPLQREGSSLKGILRAVNTWQIPSTPSYPA